MEVVTDYSTDLHLFGIGCMQDRVRELLYQTLNGSASL